MCWGTICIRDSLEWVQTVRELEQYSEDTALNPASLSDRIIDWVLSWSHLWRSQANALEPRLRQHLTRTGTHITLIFASGSGVGHSFNTGLTKNISETRIGDRMPYFPWWRLWEKNHALAQSTYRKCSLYVYSAYPGQPTVHAILFQSHFQNSCKIVLFSWNVQEKTESNHGRKYMI
jgi:hypothetical protein